MNGQGRIVVFGLVIMAVIFGMGACTNSVLNGQPAPTATPTKVAYAVGWVPTPTPTPEPGLDQPIKMIWGQLPAELQAYFLRQPATATPAPAEYVDFEVGPKGCRYTVEKNATEKFTGSLAGDCAELLRILNPVPPAPTVTPMPTAMPAPAVYKFELNDPRDACKGCTIIVSGVTGSEEVRLREVEPDGSFHAPTFITDKPVGEMLDAFVIRGASGTPFIALWYWGEPRGVVPDDGYIALDDYLALEPPAVEPEPTATPTPEPDYKYTDVWFNDEFGSYVLSATEGFRKGTSTLSIVGNYKGDLVQDEWYFGSGVHSFIIASIHPGGHVHFWYNTVEGGDYVENVHHPWWFEPEVK